MRKGKNGWLTAGAAVSLILIRLLAPGVFGTLRTLLINSRGQEAAAAVFRQQTQEAVPVFGEVPHAG